MLIVLLYCICFEFVLWTTMDILWRGNTTSTFAAAKASESAMIHPYSADAAYHSIKIIYFFRCYAACIKAYCVWNERYTSIIQHYMYFIQRISIYFKIFYFFFSAYYYEGPPSFKSEKYLKHIFYNRDIARKFWSRLL